MIDLSIDMTCVPSGIPIPGSERRLPHWVSQGGEDATAAEDAQPVPDQTKGL